MSVGYPDYQRLSLAGGYELYSATNKTITQNVVLFQGYVGTWPYLNIDLDVNGGTDHVQVFVSYFSDATFSNNVGFRYLTRAGNSFSSTQVANLSAWAQVGYHSKSGGNVNFNNFGVYATTGPVAGNNLQSQYKPVAYLNESVGAGSTAITDPSFVIPGPAVFSVSATGTTWYAELRYYDWDTDSILLITHIDQTIYAKGGVWTVGLPDAPVEIALHNGDSADKTMRMSLVSIA